jgi:hypothetical protein
MSLPRERDPDGDVDMKGKNEQLASVHHKCDECGAEKTGSHKWFPWFCGMGMWACVTCKDAGMWACVTCKDNWLAQNQAAPGLDDLLSSGASGSKDAGKADCEMQ